MINRNIILTFISAILLISMVGAASGADATPGGVEIPVASGNSLDTAPSLNVEDGAGTSSTTTLNPRAPIRKKPVPVKTPKPTTVMTAAPTVALVTIPTTVPTTVPTTIPATVPATTTAAPNQAEIQARVDAAYADGYARLAEMQAAYRAWSIPSRPDLVAIATNVKSAGLKGDGVTDDTVALQALLNQLPAGSTIYFPPSTYRIDGPITITKPFTLFGESGTVFDCQKATKYVFTINKEGSPTSPMNGMTITGIVIEGPGIETDPAMINGFYLNNFHVSFVKFHNVGYAAIRVNTCSDVIIEDCIFDKVFQTGLGYGICITDGSDRIFIRDNYFVTKGRHGIAIGTSNPNLPEADYTRSVSVENNYFEQMVSHAIDAHPVMKGPYVIQGNVIFNCDMGIVIQNGSAVVNDNIIINCRQGVDINSQSVDANSPPSYVQNNTFINTAGYAVYLFNSNVVVRNNIVGGDNAEPFIYLKGYKPEYLNLYEIVIKDNVIDGYLSGISVIISRPKFSLENNYIREKGSMFQELKY